MGLVAFYDSLADRTGRLWNAAVVRPLARVPVLRRLVVPFAGESGTDFRLRTLLACVVAGFAALAGRLAYVQCWRGEPLDRGKMARTTVIPARRGTIYDRQGVALTTQTRYARYFIDAVALDPTNQWKVVELVCELFPETDARSLDAKLTRNRELRRRYEVVGQSEDADMEARVRALVAPDRRDKSYRGLGVHAAYRREYPMGVELSHVVGFINPEGHGRAGIEESCDAILAGRPGEIRTFVNANRREIRHLREAEVAPVDGYDIELTIDHRLQHIVDDEVEAAWRDTQALAAWAVVYDCATGDILAMADRPGVDPMHPGPYTEAWRNHCIEFQYEPGSVMKPVSISGALEAKTVGPGTVIDTGHGPAFFYGRRLRDHFDGPGRPADFIRRSSNKGTAMIAMRMGKELLYDTLRRAGFGRKSGIELPREANGALRHPDTWYPINVTRICLGQSMEVTALQLACAYGAIANGGVRMRPHIVRRITDPNRGGAVVTNMVPEPAEGERFCSPTVARQMCAMLEGVVAGDPVTGERGTGRRAAIPGYRTAGKTGTAQMLVNHVYSERDYHASFCGFLPVENPRYVIIATIQRPVGKFHGGGDVAAPLFAKIALQLARLYDLPTDLVQRDFIVQEPEADPDPEGLFDPDDAAASAYDEVSQP